MSEYSAEADDIVINGASLPDDERVILALSWCNNRVTGDDTSQSQGLLNERGELNYLRNANKICASHPEGMASHGKREGDTSSSEGRVDNCSNDAPRKPYVSASINGKSASMRDNDTRNQAHLSLDQALNQCKTADSSIPSTNRSEEIFRGNIVPSGSRRLESVAAVRAHTVASQSCKVLPASSHLRRTLETGSIVARTSSEFSELPRRPKVTTSSHPLHCLEDLDPVIESSRLTKGVTLSHPLHCFSDPADEPLKVTKDVTSSHPLHCLVDPAGESLKITKGVTSSHPLHCLAVPVLQPLRTANAVISTHPLHCFSNLVEPTSNVKTIQLRDPADLLLGRGEEYSIRKTLRESVHPALIDHNYASLTPGNPKIKMGYDEDDCVIVETQPEVIFAEDFDVHEEVVCTVSSIEIPREVSSDSREPQIRFPVPVAAFEPANDIVVPVKRPGRGRPRGSMKTKTSSTTMNKASKICTGSIFKMAVKNKVYAHMQTNKNLKSCASSHSKMAVKNKVFAHIQETELHASTRFEALGYSRLGKGTKSRPAVFGATDFTSNYTGCHADSSAGIDTDSASDSQDIDVDSDAGVVTYSSGHRGATGEYHVSLQNGDGASRDSLSTAESQYVRQNNVQRKLSALGRDCSSDVSTDASSEMLVDVVNISSRQTPNRPKPCSAFRNFNNTSKIPRTVSVLKCNDGAKSNGVNSDKTSAKTMTALRCSPALRVSICPIDSVSHCASRLVADGNTRTSSENPKIRGRPKLNGHQIAVEKDATRRCIDGRPLTGKSFSVNPAKMTSDYTVKSVAIAKNQATATGNMNSNSQSRITTKAVTSSHPLHCLFQASPTPSDVNTRTLALRLPTSSVVQQSAQSTVTQSTTTQARPCLQSTSIQLARLCVQPMTIQQARSGVQPMVKQQAPSCAQASNNSPVINMKRVVKVVKLSRNVKMIPRVGTPVLGADRITMTDSLTTDIQRTVSGFANYNVEGEQICRRIPTTVACTVTDSWIVPPPLTRPQVKYTSASSCNNNQVQFINRLYGTVIAKEGSAGVDDDVIVVD